MSNLFLLFLGILDILAGIIILIFAPKEFLFIIIGLLILFKGVWTLIS
ncbi:MAG: hypothetical protein QXQ14_00055 [Candidatus Aenigmatarchaeota archaeon]